MPPVPNSLYADFSDGMHEDYPATAKVFDEMAAEENTHRRSLIDLFVSKFSGHIPLVRRQDSRGYIPQKPVWRLPWEVGQRDVPS